MKSYNIVITQPAEADLRGIVEYVALELREPLIAQNLLAKISEAIFELEKMPRRHVLVRNERLAFQGIRMLPVENYMIFYIVSERNASVTIVRVLHGKREWSRLL